MTSHHSQTVLNMASASVEREESSEKSTVFDQLTKQLGGLVLKEKQKEAVKIYWKAMMFLLCSVLALERASFTKSLSWLKKSKAVMSIGRHVWLSCRFKA